MFMNRLHHFTRLSLEQEENNCPSGMQDRPPPSGVPCSQSGSSGGGGGSAALATKKERVPTAPPDWTKRPEVSPMPCELPGRERLPAQ